MKVLGAPICKVLKQPFRPLFESLSVFATNKANERRSLLARNVKNAFRGELDLDQVKPLHKRQALLNEGAPNEEFAISLRHVGMQALRPNQIGGVNDEMIQPSKLGEVEAARMGHFQNDNAPDPCLKGAVEKVRLNGLGHAFPFHDISPSFTK